MEYSAIKIGTQDCKSIYQGKTLLTPNYELLSQSTKNKILDIGGGDIEYLKDVLTYLKEKPELIPYVEENPGISDYLFYTFFDDFILKHNLHKYSTPRLAIDANDDKEERHWFIHSSYGSSDWMYVWDNLLYDDFEYLPGGFTPTSNYVSKVGTTNYTSGTLMKLFIPETIPTGYSEWFADRIIVYVNGQQILDKGDWHNSRRDVEFDFSGIITPGELNNVIIQWSGSGNHGVDFGFLN